MYQLVYAEQYKEILALKGSKRPLTNHNVRPLLKEYKDPKLYYNEGQDNILDSFVMFKP